VGSFITGTELEVIRDDENWRAFESVTIREYNQGQKDALDNEIIEMAGIVGQIPKVVMQSVLVPVLVAGIHSWTLRDLSDEEVQRLYEAQAKALGKDIETLSVEERCEAVKDVPIVPATREWMAKLKPSYASFIVQEIRRLNRGRTSAEERDFLRQVGAEHLIEDRVTDGDSAD
jgi:hypothetical protein